MANTTRFNFKYWILKGWGAVILIIIASSYGLFKTGYECGQYVSESDHKDIITNMRIDYQDKLAQVKEKADDDKQKALKDLAQEKKEETDRLYQLITNTSGKR